jgi:N-acetylglucosaminyl-diphospho-decaprenol L-rhamnosyltransferase
MAAPRPTSAPRLGVVTVSYGSDDVLRGLLASIPDAAREPVAVVVADNLPSEGDAAGIAAEFGAEHVPLPENPGYGGAVNAGAARLPSSVEWLLVVNPDAALGPGSIATLVARGASDPTIGAVGPLVRNADGTVYPSARAVPSLRTGVGHAMLGPVWPGNPWTRAYRRDSDETPRVRDAGWLSGSCELVRRSAFDRVGGFDDGYFMYFEDVDLGVRLARAGYRNVYEPAAEVVHTGAHSTGQASERMIRAHHDSARRFLARKYPGALLWPVRAVLSVGLRLRSAWILRRTRGTSGGEP